MTQTVGAVGATWNSIAVYRTPQGLHYPIVVVDPAAATRREKQDETDAAAGLAHRGPVDGRTSGVVGQLHRERLGIGCLCRYPLVPQQMSPRK